MAETITLAGADGFTSVAIDTFPTFKAIYADADGVAQFLFVRPSCSQRGRVGLRLDPVLCVGLPLRDRLGRLHLGGLFRGGLFLSRRRILGILGWRLRRRGLHRVVDGADAARFLVTLKERLEGGAFEADLGL